MVHIYKTIYKNYFYLKFKFFLIGFNIEILRARDHINQKNIFLK